VRGVKAVTAAGSMRRMRETVGDIDILAIAAESGDVMGRFVRYGEVKEVISQGPTRASVLLQSGLQADLRVVPEKSYGAALHYSRRLAAAHGLDPVRLGKQIDEIERTRIEGITLLKGIEVDILEDGALDLPDSALGELDLVIAAVHSAFGLTRARQTERILRALDNPRVTMLAHPLGRLIGSREPYEVDMLKIVRKAAARGRFLELNAHPERLDLLDIHCRMAKDEGVLVSVNSDAHSVEQFDNLRCGIGQARRGWLEKRDVLNARPLPDLQALLRRQAAGAASC
jgi:DNA polymerase (family 10)